MAHTTPKQAATPSQPPLPHPRVGLSTIAPPTCTDGRSCHDETVYTLRNPSARLRHLLFLLWELVGSSFGLSVDTLSFFLRLSLQDPDWQ